MIKCKSILLVVFTSMLLCANGYGEKTTTRGFKKLQGFKYSQPIIIAVVGSPITASTPSFTQGLASKFEISPALPQGFVFDTKTGVISGVPTVGSEKALSGFTVTAFNPVSNTSTLVEIVIQPLQKFLVVDHENSRFHILNLATQQVTVFDNFGLPTCSAFGNGRFAVATENDGIIFIDAVTNEVQQIIKVAEFLAADANLLFRDNHFFYADEEIGGLIIDSSGDENVIVAEIPFDEGILGSATFVEEFFAVPTFFPDGEFPSALALVNTTTGEIEDEIALEGGGTISVAVGNGIIAYTDDTFANISFIDIETQDFIDFFFFDRLPTQVLFGNNFFATVVPEEDGERSEVIFYYAVDRNISELVSFQLEGAVHLDFGNNRFLIANQTNGTVSVVEVGVNGDGLPFANIVSTIEVNSTPSNIVFGGNHFLVSHRFDDTAILIDAISGEKVANINNISVNFTNPLSSGQSCFSFDNNSSFCVVHDQRQAFIINGNTNGIERQFFVGGPPRQKLPANYLELRKKICRSLRKYKHSKDPKIKQKIEEYKKELARLRAIKNSQKVAVSPLPKSPQRFSKLSPKLAAFSDGKFFAIVANNVIVIDATTHKKLSTNFIFAPQTIIGTDEHVAIATTNGVSIRRSSDFNEVAFVNFANTPFDIVFGNNLLMAVSTNEVKIFDITGNVSKVFSEPAVIGAATLAFGDNHFAVHGLRTTLIDATTFDIVLTLDHGSSTPADTVTFGNGQFVTSHRNDDRVRLINIAQTKTVAEVLSEGEPVATTFGDNRFVSINNIANTLDLINATTKTKVAQVAVDVLPDFVLFGNNRFVVGCGNGNIDAVVTIVDSLRNKKMASVFAPFQTTGGYLSIAFNPSK
ncbi:Ig domain-containing protein [Candidatus Uabimicrobium amorphum]|uniref:Uncharacterized protein n=1 Tax=Uabimicrobium amorphum TaxID=2596890 RepID=A0A5S9F4W1_UABAM|nr:Ig domain-containing protein [Candidatus Uabimicrobium amorphum]BBM86196.1 hypothetical protein UABAM_04582 [Candidatus Uabimicrobium amorphum]